MIAILAFGVIAFLFLLLVAAGVALIAKRPRLLIPIGLASLALFIAMGAGLSFLAFDRVSTRKEVYYGRNTYPTQQSIERSYDSSTSILHNSKRIMLLPIAAVFVAFVVGMALRSKGSSGGTAWLGTAMLLLVFGLLFGVYGVLNVRVTKRSNVVQGDEIIIPFQRQPGENASVMQILSRSAKMQAQAKAEAQRQKDLAEAQWQKLEQERTARLHTLLPQQFATMDINQLIELFTAPRIELQPTEPVGAVAPLPVIQAPGAPPPPVIAAVEVPLISTQTTVEASATASSTQTANEQQAKRRGTEKKPNAKKKVVVKTDDAEAKAVAVAADTSPKALTKDLNNGDKPAENVRLPNWVHEQAGMYGQDWREIIATDEYATEEEARRAMDIYLLLKTAERVESLEGKSTIAAAHPSITFNSGGQIIVDGQIIFDPHYSNRWLDGRINSLNDMGIGMNEIRRSVVRNQFMASRESARAFDTVYKQYTQAQFTPWFDDQLRKLSMAAQRRDRLAAVGIGAGSVLGVLGLIFGLLKIDTWTKGYYSKRLFLGVPATIIGGVFAVILIISLVDYIS